MNGFTPSAECVRCRELERQLSAQQQQLAAQEQHLAALQTRLEKLQKQLEKQTRAGKRQAAPFRRTKKKQPDEQGKPGRKPGHARDARPEPDTVDRTIAVTVDVCPN